MSSRDAAIDLLAPGSEPLALTKAARAAGAEALARVGAVETIEAAYDAWLELRRQQAQVRTQVAAERQTIDQQGSFLLGALGVAEKLVLGDVGSADALARVAGDVQVYQREARARLERSRQALEEQAAAAEVALASAAERVREAIRQRIERHAKLARPRLRLTVATLAGRRRVLQAQRPDPDDAVVLLWLFSARVPSRYGFLFDDSTDDVALPPPVLYPEEGVSAEHVRPPVPRLRPLLDALPEVWPVKGILPLTLPALNGAAVSARFVERGAVMEAEVEDADTFRSILTQEEAEHLTGYLLALKLENRLDLELVRA